MTRTYPYGYRTATPDNPRTWPAEMLTAEQLMGKQPWARLHPEVRRRHLAIFDAAQEAGTILGIGGGWRSAAQQEATFRARYEPGYNANAKSRVYWDTDPAGPRWWSIKSNGLAPSTPPGRSYHEECREVDDGDPNAAWAYAVDTIGDWQFLARHCAEFGLVEFSKVNDEPWHSQPVELPTARRSYAGQTLKVWPLPGEAPVVIPPVVPPPPTNGASVMSMKIIREADGLDAEHDFAAWFYGQVDEHGIAHFVEWTGEGGDPAVQQRLSEELAAGATFMPVGIGSLKNCVLIGPMPPDGSDIKHQWRKTDFAKVIG